MGENHCLCDLYLGPPTQMDFMLRSRTRNSCCICLLPSHFDVGMLHKVKHDRAQLKDFYDKLLKTFGCPFGTEMFILAFQASKTAGSSFVISMMTMIFYLVYNSSIKNDNLLHVLL